MAHHGDPVSGAAIQSEFGGFTSPRDGAGLSLRHVPFRKRVAACCEGQIGLRREWLRGRATFLTRSNPVSMVRAVSKRWRARPAFLGRGVESMAGDAREQDDDGTRSTNETALSARLKRLGERLDATGASRQPGADPGNHATVDPSALARGLRLSSEFVVGVLAGAGLGWVVDHWLKTSPWGLIGLTLLGFVASVVNLIRASNASAGAPPNRRADRRQH